MTDTKTAARNIRKALKLAGIEARAVSVTISRFSMGSSISVYIKDVNVDFPTVERIASELGEHDGVSRFVHVEFSSEACGEIDSLLGPMLPEDGDETVDFELPNGARVAVTLEDGYYRGRGAIDAMCFGRECASRVLWTQGVRHTHLAIAV